MRDRILYRASSSGDDLGENFQSFTPFVTNIGKQKKKMEGNRKQKIIDVLFERYVGDKERVAYLSNILSRNTYIVTFNKSVDKVYNVLKRIHSDFPKNRIFSLRSEYKQAVKSGDGFLTVEEKIPHVKLNTISIVAEKTHGPILYVDDEFDRFFINHVLQKIRSVYTFNTYLNNLEYYHVDETMSGLEVDSSINISKYNQIFLDFDDTITRNARKSPVEIEGIKYDYEYFLHNV